MGLLKIAKKGADELVELADNLLNAKKADEWDEAAWLAANPRPHPEIRTVDMTEKQKKEYRVWKSRKFAAKNKDKVREYNRRYEEEKRVRPEGFFEAQNERVRNKYQEDPEFRRSKRERDRKRYAETPEVRAQTLARRNARRASEMQRTPTWADPSKIKEIYNARAIIEQATGIPHHVDHMIPLQGKNVSGLHHQDNLMIVPGAENLSKNNRFTPGTPPPKTGGVRQARRLLKQLEAAKQGR